MRALFYPADIDILSYLFCRGKEIQIKVHALGTVRNSFITIRQTDTIFQYFFGRILSIFFRGIL